MIISKKKYEEMIDCLREAQKAINSLRSEIVVYEAIVKKLQKENNFLKSIIKCYNIDFPATEKLHEDKFI